MTGVSDETSATQTTAHQHGNPGRVLHTVLAALAGPVAASASLAVAELASVVVRPQASPVTAVGGAAIDLAPPQLKDFAVRHFGTDDKLVLQLGIVAVLAVFAALVGVVASRYRVAGSAAVLLFGAVGVAAAVSRPDATTLDPLPSVLGAVVGAGVLYALSGRLRLHPSGSAVAVRNATASGSHTTSEQAPPAGGFDRRGFVLAAAAAAAASAGAGVLGRSLNATSGARAAASRTAVRLPRPTSPAAPVPERADLRIPGLSPFVTPNSSFYRIDTALVIPRVDATTWRMRLHGKGVSEERHFTYQDLLARELIERDITLTCVSNEVGGPYAGNARWIGVRLADLLREAGVRPPSRGGPADQLLARSVDGMTIGSPVEAVMDGRDAMLAVGMNGEPLPFAHGFPVRMVVPGLYGYVSACKWLTDLELTAFDAYDAYWVKRSWSRQAPIKTESRIDTPRPFASLAAGTIPVAGVAWAQHKGIDRVEVRVDGGPWHPATLAAEDTADTWRQWMWPWPATPGSHTLEVRATDRTGYTQTGERVGTLPDGATGWHSVVVTVT